MIHRATVTRATTAGVWIMIPATWPGVEFGPCDLVATAVRVGPLTTTSASSPDPHTHTIAKTTWLADLVQAGDDVLAVETGRADFVIVGTIRTGVSTTGAL